MGTTQIVGRVAVFWLLYAAIFAGLGLVLGMAPPSARMLVAGTIITAITLAITWALTKSEGATLASVGAAWSRHSIKRFAIGFAGGLAMVALLVVVTRVVVGPMTFVRETTTTVSMVPIMILTFVMLSAGEETGFRGYPFQRLRQRFGTWPAQLVGALAFAAYHMFQGWPWQNALLGTTAGALLFGLAAIVSGGLALPIGLHAAWNVGSWIIGTKGDAGLWRMDLGRQPSFLSAAVCYFAVMAAAAWVIWSTRDRWADRAAVDSPPL